MWLNKNGRSGDGCDLGLTKHNVVAVVLCTQRPSLAYFCFANKDNTDYPFVFSSMLILIKVPAREDSFSVF